MNLIRIFVVLILLLFNISCKKNSNLKFTFSANVFMNDTLHKLINTEIFIDIVKQSNTMAIPGNGKVESLKSISTDNNAQFTKTISTFEGAEQINFSILEPTGTGLFTKNTIVFKISKLQSQTINNINLIF